MATPKASQLRNEPCWLVGAPTDLAGSYPYGGTELGFASEVQIDRGVERVRVGAEEYGGTTVLSSYRKKSLVVAVNMRGWDPDLLALLPGGSASNSGTLTSSTVTTPGPGVALTQFKLVLVPENDKISGTTDGGIGLILYAATVLPQPGAVARKGYSVEWGIPVFFEAELDGTGREWDEGILSSLAI